MLRGTLCKMDRACGVVDAQRRVEGGGGGFVDVELQTISGRVYGVQWLDQTTSRTFKVAKDAMALDRSTISTLREIDALHVEIRCRG